TPFVSISSILEDSLLPSSQPPPLAPSTSKSHPMIPVQAISDPPPQPDEIPGHSSSEDDSHPEKPLALSILESRPNPVSVTWAEISNPVISIPLTLKSSLRPLKSSVSASSECSSQPQSL